MVAKSIAKMYTNIHKPTDYILKHVICSYLPALGVVLMASLHELTSTSTDQQWLGRGTSG